MLPYPRQCPPPPHVPWLPVVCMRAPPEAPEARPAASDGVATATIPAAAMAATNSDSDGFHLRLLIVLLVSSGYPHCRARATKSTRDKGTNAGPPRPDDSRRKNQFLAGLALGLVLALGLGWVAVEAGLAWTWRKRASSALSQEALGVGSEPGHWTW